MLAHFSRFSFLLCLIMVFLALPLYGEEMPVEGVSNTEVLEEGGDAEVSDAEKRVHLTPEFIEQAALADESVKKQIVWLDTSEGGETSFLALELYENSAESQGAVLFLHGVEQHPNWPQVIKPMRTILTDDGWYTLSIMLPYEHYQSVPSRDLQAKLSESVQSSDTAPRFSGRYSKLSSPDGDEDKSGGGGRGESTPKLGETEDKVAEEESTETAEDLVLKESVEEVIDISADAKASTPSTATFEEKVQIRLKAGLDHIAEKGYQNIVLVGYQQGAQGVLDYLSSNKGFLPEQGLTIIWVDAVLTEDQLSRFGDSIGKEFSLNMLDVVDASSRKGVLEGKKRVGQARRNSYSGYSFVKLPIADMRQVEVSTLTQRIRGWLKKNAPGMQARKVN